MKLLAELFVYTLDSLQAKQCQNVATCVPSCDSFRHNSCCSNNHIWPSELGSNTVAGLPHTLKTTSLHMVAPTCSNDDVLYVLWQHLTSDPSAVLDSALMPFASLINK